ncbi:MAG: hemerythrin family protein [Magnetococcales bacterium]|nr:hemerythrin family protein [Magnetococcales bacterium]
MSEMFIDKSTLGSPYRISYNVLRNIGDPILDGHHHDILSLLIHLADLLKKKRWEPSNKEIRVHTIDLFMKIRDSLAQHCEIEENLMRQKGYPQIEEHQEEHDLLLVRLDGFIYHCRRQGHPSFRLVKDFIRIWFLAHVNESDAHFRDYLLVVPSKPLPPAGEFVPLLGT